MNVALLRNRKLVTAAASLDIFHVTAPTKLAAVEPLQVDTLVVAEVDKSATSAVRWGT